MLEEKSLKLKERLWKHSTLTLERENFSMKEAMFKREILIQNRIDLASLQQVERIQREFLQEQSLDLATQFLSSLQLKLEKFTKQQYGQSLSVVIGEKKHYERQRLLEEKDAKIEDDDRLRGREELKKAREAAAQEWRERQAVLEERRKEEESYRAARTFVQGEELRQRQALHGLQDVELKNILLELKEGEAEAHRLEYERFINSDEQKRIVAEREAKIHAEREAQIKKDKEFKKEQLRMVTRCTHSRLGTSVFIGPLAKKMCLICKIKFDEGKGIYVRMP